MLLIGGYEKSRSERQQSNAKRARLRDFHLLTLALKRSWLDFRHEGLRGDANKYAWAISRMNRADASVRAHFSY